MKQLELIDEAKVAINHIFLDISVDRKTIHNSLIELKDLIQVNIEILEDCMKVEDCMKAIKKENANP